MQDKFEPFDVIDELFGECMRNACRKKFASCLSDFRGSPVYINVIKVLLNYCDSEFEKKRKIFSQSVNSKGQIFPPILALLEHANIDTRRLLERRDAKTTGKDHQTTANGNLNVTFLSFAYSVLSINLTKIPFSEECRSIVTDESGMYPLSFCGSTKAVTGPSVAQIEQGVEEVLRQNSSAKDVRLDVAETGVKAIDAKTREIAIFLLFFLKYRVCD